MSEPKEFEQRLIDRYQWKTARIQLKCTYVHSRVELNDFKRYVIEAKKLLEIEHLTRLEKLV